MSSFSSVRDLTKYIQKKIDDVLISEVTNEIKKIELKHIAEDVMQVYNPKQYERRDTGGIEDPDNINGELVKSGVLEVKNTTTFSPDPESNNFGTGLVGLIEHGDGWDGHRYEYGNDNAEYKGPRPFIQNTQNDLRSNLQHIEALKSGLKKHNIIAK